MSSWKYSAIGGTEKEKQEEDETKVEAKKISSMTKEKKSWERKGEKMRAYRNTGKSLKKSRL